MFNLCRPLGCSWDQIWPIGALRGPWGPPKGLFGAKSSPFKAPWGPEGARYQVKVCFDHEPNSGGPMGGSWDQIWPPRPSEDLRGPQKGLLEPKRALLGAIEVLYGAQVHDMDASDPGALCGSVFDAIWPVLAVPGAQRGPKGAQKMKIFTFWLF